MAGVLATSWDSLDWNEQGQATNFKAAVFDPTIRFTSRAIDAFVIALGLIPFVNPADVMDLWLHLVLTRRRNLSDLPDRPRFVINAANLATGVSWRFSKRYMADSTMGAVCAPKLRLSRAIAASAAYPPFVAPLVLNLRKMTLVPLAGAKLFDDPAAKALKSEVRLLDGGAYDNLGVESVEGRCRIVLASDAGGNLSVDTRDWRYHFWWPLVRRTLDLAVEVGRRQRRRALIENAIATSTLKEAGLPATSATEQVALWRTALQIAGHPSLPPGWVVDEGWANYIAMLPTRMWPMAKADQQRVVNWGYLTADLMLRTWIPELHEVTAPDSLPFNGAGFQKPPPH
jgi:NTE family protein